MSTFRKFEDEKPEKWRPILVTDFKDTTVCEHNGYDYLCPLGVLGHEWEWEFKSSQFTHWMYIEDVMGLLRLSGKDC